MTLYGYLYYFGFSVLFLLNIYLTLFLKVRRRRAFADKYAVAAFIAGAVSAIIACVNIPFILSNDTRTPLFLMATLLNSISLSIQLIYCFDKKRRGTKKC